MAAVVARNFLSAGLRRGGFLARVRPRRDLTTSLAAFSDKQGKEDMDELKENPYYNKYAEKIAKLQKYDVD